MPPVEDNAVPRGVLSVRPNRVRCVVSAAIGLPLATIFLLIDPVAENDRVGEMLLGVAYGLPLGWSIGALFVLFRGPMLRFDVRTRKIRVPHGSNWRFTSVYPSRGFDRIEYSPYDARLYQVKADGKRSRLPIPRIYANRRDWMALADILLQDQRPGHPQPRKTPRA